MKVRERKRTTKVKKRRDDAKRGVVGPTVFSFILFETQLLDIDDNMRQLDTFFSLFVSLLPVFSPSDSICFRTMRKMSDAARRVSSVKTRSTISEAEELEFTEKPSGSSEVQKHCLVNVIDCSNISFGRSDGGKVAKYQHLTIIHASQGTGICVL
ncbi:hypothetical protein BCR43DRAFT_125235 [Syncephalastrum racemosum]|uniref:Uncharacterized protein n=1 Tax=Syncephalastrum racemosum TaxID=13706 RepID=A0A1X2HKW1_SYNRA|nr:hypothetical protein BCR43DRAFT_125235 [Syncephalastrum racemosum]